MNAVEIEEAVSKLAEAPFDPAAFPYAFLEAFGNKETTLKRLRSGNTNQSDVPGGVLQRSNIHIKVCPEGEVPAALAALRQSAATARHKAKFILATDGKSFEAENLVDGETLACAYADFHDHFGFFLPLAGITTVKQIRENAFDIKATGRLNRLYIELLRENPDWDTAARRPDLNHFFARLIFCFFAEDTNIFHGTNLFTSTVEQMSARDSSNTHEVLSEIFRAMNTRPEKLEAAGIRNWARSFPYVNGGLFSGSMDVPRFSRIARSYLIHVGSLDWTKINPDIFGSMIQAVADDEERGALGMHYTSVPNILKVLNPLFLDDLRQKLEEAGDNARKLLNLRERMARIRVFDPACGSGNFLVIAYKEMRAIEVEINRRRGEAERASEIPLTNFRGIELRHFSAEIARLALIIAEFQCDVLYRGQKLALAEFLPLDAANWITCGNALRLDWLKICPPTGTGVKVRGDDLFNTPLDQMEIDFANAGGETYICGNPPYLGSRWQSNEQKSELKSIFEGQTTSWKSLDYVAGWFIKAANYGCDTISAAAFVATNSICQGLQVPILWPLIFAGGHEISFAYTSFKWSNLASHNAGVTVVIVGICNRPPKVRRLFALDDAGNVIAKDSQNINAYLSSAPTLFVEPLRSAHDSRPEMLFGNMPRDGGFLCFDEHVKADAIRSDSRVTPFIKKYLGSAEMIQGKLRYCLWITSDHASEAMCAPIIASRLKRVAEERSKSSALSTQLYSKKPYRFVQIQGVAARSAIAIAGVSSERREFLPVALFDSETILSNLLFGIYDAPLWNMALIASRLHLTWIATVCGKLKTDYRYSNTLGWNTFPVPTLTEQDKANLTRCAEDILLAREAHFPATIADLYDPDTMPANLREAHERNDETLERIYIGRRFKNDTERLEKLFEMYTQMTAGQAQGTSKGPKKPAKRKMKGDGG
jgi:hypothetical protein